MFTSKDQAKRDYELFHTDQAELEKWLTKHRGIKNNHIKIKYRAKKKRYYELYGTIDKPYGDIPIDE